MHRLLVGALAAVMLASAVTSVASVLCSLDCEQEFLRGCIPFQKETKGQGLAPHERQKIAFAECVKAIAKGSPQLTDAGCVKKCALTPTMEKEGENGSEGGNHEQTIMAIVRRSA